MSISVIGQPGACVLVSSAPRGRASRRCCGNGSFRRLDSADPLPRLSSASYAPAKRALCVLRRRNGDLADAIAEQRSLVGLRLGKRWSPFCRSDRIVASPFGLVDTIELVFSFPLAQHRLQSYVFERTARCGRSGWFIGERASCPFGRWRGNIGLMCQR